MKKALIRKADMDVTIRNACIANGCPSLADNVRVEWSRRFVRSAGMAELRTMTIKLATRVMFNMSQAEQLEVVASEACHLIAWHLHQVSSHDQGWKACMVKAGYPAKRRTIFAGSSTAKRHSSKESHSPYSFSCACRKDFVLAPATARMIALEGAPRTCDDCKQAIKLTGNRYVDGYVS